MRNIFVIDAHDEYEFARGKLNQSLTEIALEHFATAGYQTQLTTMKDDWMVDDEIEKYQ